MSEPAASESQGVIGWLVHNRITPNLLMLCLLGGGLLTSFRIKQEVFPDFDLDVVSIEVTYPGSSPEEVERGVVLAIEDAVHGIEGIDELEATANEGGAVILAELLEGVDGDRVYQEIQQAVDRVRTLPTEAERPVVSRLTRRRAVLTVQLYGNLSEHALRNVAEEVRDRLLQADGISQVELVGAREPRILVEVPEHTLRAYGLTLQEVAARIGNASVEVPGGSVETSGGEILLRVKDRRDWAQEFANIPIVTDTGGTAVRLGDIAQLREGFEDVDRYASFNGMPALGVEVFRVGEQTPIGVSDQVRALLDEIVADLPDGVNWVVSNDRSERYRDRLNLLLKNALLGLGLVLLVLGLFLDPKLAFWVTMGIPTAFLGGLVFLPALGVSINMISLFAFIVALGIVVDDAIIAGENIYEHRRQGMSNVQAAIEGAKDVTQPIAFSILTNCVAFLPMYFVPGTMGKIFKYIPLVIVTVFLISWVEALVILPSHLAHTKDASSKPPGRIARWRLKIADGLQLVADRFYLPLLTRALSWRSLTLSIGLAALVVVGAYVKSGRIGVELLPRVESDVAFVTATLPFGSPISRARQVEQKLLKAVQQVAQDNGGEKLVSGVFSLIDENRVEVTAFLTEPAVRPLSTTAVTNKWREAVGSIFGLQSLRFETDRGGPGSGAAISVELSHRDIDTLDRASEDLGQRLAEYPNITDIDDGYASGKQQLDFQLTAAGESLGLTSSAIARQVRDAFYGAEAARQQRERNELRVLVRRPESERVAEYDVESLMILTPAGVRVPLRQVARVKRGRSFTAITRRDTRRTVTVQANVEPSRDTSRITAVLNESVLPALVADYPGLTYSYEGRQADRVESVKSLLWGQLAALLLIYILLAIPFRSYVQPLIIMAAIPFGVIGAVLGHLLMGFNLSILSLMGIVALSGVVVNDSLVLIDYANRQRRKGISAQEAVRLAGVRRFRPVVLTTLTTFCGLGPMIFETSRQARFLIPMALSLGFGILFATLVTLVLVPSLYVSVDNLVDRVRGRKQRTAPGYEVGQSSATR